MAPFDAVVFAERQPGKWMAGSEGFTRTRDLMPWLRMQPPGAWVHVAAVYSWRSYDRPLSKRATVRSALRGRSASAHVQGRRPAWCWDDATKEAGARG